MSKEFTEEEVREKFLRKVNRLVTYWLNENSQPDVKEKLEGLAFSILSMIDGSQLDLPGFILAPLPAEEDKDYCIENGEDYFPQNHSSNVKCDIAGGLHELLHKYRS